MNSKLRPAIIGGLIAGLLVAFPYTSCCLWAILGGLLAGYLYIKKSTTVVPTGEGAVVGLLAGLIGGIVQLVVGLPLVILIGVPWMGAIISWLERMDPKQADRIRHTMEAMQNRPFLEQLIARLPGAMLGFVLTIVFATIGGLIAVAIFEKRARLPATPPPPPAF